MRRIEETFWMGIRIREVYIEGRKAEYGIGRREAATYSSPELF